MNFKRLLATFLAAISLSMGLVVADSAPASAICVTTRLYNASSTYSFYYMDQYNQWNSLAPRATTPTSKTPRQAQTPIGRNAKVSNPNLSTFVTGSGEKWLVYSCKGTYSVATY